MKKHSKRYSSILEQADGSATFSVPEAVAQMKKNATAKFVESVELAIKLDIDTKQSDQLVRGSFSLPNGTGKSMRVIAFAEGDDAAAAREAGAIEVGSDDLAAKIQKENWMDFDVAVAHPSMMKHVGKLGKVLGPKGMMPSPKSGTVNPDVGQAVREFVAGKLEFRNDSQGNICVCIGKADFEDQKLVENIEAMLTHVRGLRPTAVKGAYISRVTISSTMGIGYRVAI